MFEAARAVAPLSYAVGDVDVDAIERAFHCALPPDYRTFLTTFGPGTLDLDPPGEMDVLQVWAPTEVIVHTPRLRAMYGAPEGDEQGRLFWYFENAAEVLEPADIERLVFIGWSDNADHFALLPGQTARYYEFPRHRQRIIDGGTTFDTFLASIDPRDRHEPRERWIVERGVARSDDGRATGRLSTYTFTPDGYSPPPGQWLDQTLTWRQADGDEGHERVTDSDFGAPPASIVYLMDYYPVLALFEALALGDPSVRFEVRAGEEPDATLVIPRYEATVQVGPGESLQDATLRLHVRREQATALWRWLMEEARRLGYVMPADLGAGPQTA